MQLEIRVALTNCNPVFFCLFFFHSLETVANVDDVLGEMFLEEVQSTEEQLIVGIQRKHYNLNVRCSSVKYM